MWWTHLVGFIWVHGGAETRAGLTIFFLLTNNRWGLADPEVTRRLNVKIVDDLYLILTYNGHYYWVDQSIAISPNLQLISDVYIRRFSWKWFQFCLETTALSLSYQIFDEVARLGITDVTDAGRSSVKGIKRWGGTMAAARAIVERCYRNEAD